MEKIEKVVWGIIGAGDVCERKSTPAMYKTPFSEVKTVMRRNAEKAADFAKRHGVGRWTTNVVHEQPIQQHLVQLIVDELRGLGTSPSTGISGARATGVMEEITKGK